MSQHDSGGPSTDRVHPFVYRIVLALALLLILSVWGFSGGPHVGFALTAATLFICVTLVLSYVMRHIARIERGRDLADAPGEGPHGWRQDLAGEGRSLRRWLSGDFVSYSGRVPARDAMIELLLPVLAVSLGMLVFAIVLHIAVPGAA